MILVVVLVHDTITSTSTDTGTIISILLIAGTCDETELDSTNTHIQHTNTYTRIHY